MNNAAVDTQELEHKVKAMYDAVAENPHGEFHFEMGRALAERLGYDTGELDRVPPASIESFAGVGHHFDLAAPLAGEAVLDLGSGSGMDSFVAGLRVGAHGRVVGIDMTDTQRAKAERLRDEFGFSQVEYFRGYIEEVPQPDLAFDVVISNGVINLSADKPAVFREAARLLRPGGRLAISDIVSERPLPEGIVCNATLWAACIGGATQQDAYRRMIEDAGLRVTGIRDNPAYRFLSDSARAACAKYGVKSISLLALKD